MAKKFKKTPEGKLEITETTEHRREVSRDELTQQRAQAVLERDAAIAEIEEIDELLAKADELNV